MYQIPCYPDNWHLHYRKPLNGTLEDFWADNPIWAEWLRTVAEKNMRSLYVLTTDRLGSILYFNQKKAWIQEGREFTEEELSGGSPVCIISETLAKYNQLSVGDVIPLTLYKTSFYIEGDTLHDINYMNDTLLKEETPVTIVGIFSAPKEPFGKKPFSLSFNTVIMPAAFVPVISRAESFPASVTLMENPAYTKDGKLVENLDRAAFDAYWEWQIFLRGMHLAPDLFTAIIENDRMDAFKAEERRTAACGRLACDTASRHYCRQCPLRNLLCNMQPHGCKCTAFRRSI
jgi:hypothetical protein